MQKFFHYLLMGFISSTLLACGAGKDKTNVEVVQGMMDQVSFKSQDYDSDRKEASNRTPPEGTVPRGYTPYKYHGKYVTDAKSQNPLAREGKLELGALKYGIYCGICHGEKGDGQGIVGLKLAIKKAPNLLTGLAMGYTDGQIFHIITEGQGLMGSYASQIPREEDRWAIVNYVRKLQRANK